MASIYNKNGVLYVSWWDWAENKTKNRSLKMKDSVINRREAKVFAKKTSEGIGCSENRFKQICINKRFNY